jgi:hypothetical protein
MQQLFAQYNQQQQQKRQQQQQQQQPVSPDSAANICKSNGNLQKFQGELAACRTGDDTARFQAFFSKLDDVKGFFDGQFAQFNDMIAAGDKFYGASANSTVLAEVSQRNKDLQATLETLQKDTKKLKGSTERHERDFLDVRAALPEQLPTQRLNVLDDYTMLLLTVSYLVMALSIVFYYAQVNNYTITSILGGTIGMALISCVVYVMALTIL